MAPVAAILTIGTIVTAAIVAPGYDTQETPRLETGVWVTRDDNQYARVNTELGEIDTTHAVAQPGGLVQSGSRGLVFTQGYVQAWPLDGAHPTDLVAGGQGDSAASAATKVMATPNGTSRVDSAGPYVLYLTTAGQVYLGTLPDGVTKPASPRQLNPFADAVAEQGAEQPRYVADAVAIDADGNVAMYSSADGGVRRFSTSTGRFVGGVTTVPRAPGRGDGLDMAIVNSHWVLMSASARTMWIEGLDQTVALDVAGDALLQSGATKGNSVLVADSTGLVEVALDGSNVARVATAQGTPAAPVVVDGVSYAAWVSNTSASMWSSKGRKVQPLDIDAQALAAATVAVPRVPFERRQGGVVRDGDRPALDSARWQTHRPFGMERPRGEHTEARRDPSRRRHRARAPRCEAGCVRRAPRRGRHTARASQ